jgi:hypothetical protein
MFIKRENILGCSGNRIMIQEKGIIMKKLEIKDVALNINIKIGIETAALVFILGLAISN